MISWEGQDPRLVVAGRRRTLERRAIRRTAPMPQMVPWGPQAPGEVRLPAARYLDPRAAQRAEARARALRAAGGRDPATLENSI